MTRNKQEIEESKTNETQPIQGRRANLKNRGNIVILKADKENAIILLNKEDYRKHMIELLYEKNCKEIRKDSTEKIMKAVRQSIKNSSISNPVLLRGSKPPSMYEITKILKVGVPLRPIVSNLTWSG